MGIIRTCAGFSRRLSESFLTEVGPTLDRVATKPVFPSLVETRNSRDWEVDSSLVALLGEKPMEYRMPNRVSKLGAFVCPFPSNVSMQVANYKVCRSDKVCENNTQTQLLLKKVLAACLMVANTWYEDFGAAMIELETISDVVKLEDGDQKIGYVALGYAISLCADTISKLEEKKSAAETRRLAGEAPPPAPYFNEDKKRRVIPNPKEAAEAIHKDTKFVAATKKARKIAYGDSPTSLRVTIPGAGRGRRGNFRGRNARTDRTRGEDQSTAEDTAGATNAAPRGRGARGRGK